MKPPSAVATAALCLLILAGCTPTPSSTSPAPSPSPTYWCTPEAGGTSYRCTQAQFEQMQAQDKLYAEAEAVYRKFFAEDDRIFRVGGIDAPTQVLEETTTGAFLRDSMKIYKALRSTRTHTKGNARIAWLKRVPQAVKTGSVVAMKACTDGSDSIMVTKGQPDESSGYISDTLYFARVEGTLKIATAEGDVVEKC